MPADIVGLRCGPLSLLPCRPSWSLELISTGGSQQSLHSRHADSQLRRTMK